MKRNKKIYIISLISILVSLFLVTFFIWLLLRGIEKNSKDLISSKNDIFTLAARTNETENFKKNYGNYEPNFKKIDQLFIDPNNPVDFIKFLESTAYNFQITSQISLRPSFQNAQQGTGGIIKNFIIFQLSSRGNFSDVLNFVKKIENGPYLIEIENLTIGDSGASESGKKTAVSSASKNVDATFTIKAFITPQLKN